MKTASSALQAHLAQPETTLAWLWEVKRMDGTILGFTSHDQNIVYDALNGDGPVTYLASTGMASTAAEGNSDLAVDNLEAAGFLDSDSITESDIRGGLYDNAEIVLRLVNWADLTMGHLIIRQGYTGNVKMKNGMFTAELRGLAQKLTTAIGGTYGETCRADLFSTPESPGVPGSHWICGLNRANYVQNGTLATVVDDRTLVPASGLLKVGSLTPTVAAPAGWFNDGILTFTSGACQHVVAEIKSWDGTTLILFLSLPEFPSAGDAFSIEPGCNKGTDCQVKFQNIVNKQAEPFIPGMDQLLDYAS
jgi:uncharacterized phage protein (TIGR02218 family)